MNDSEKIGLIISILNRHMIAESGYSIFLLGRGRLSPGNVMKSYDFAIDSEKNIPFDDLIAMEKEIRSLTKTDKIYLIDINRIDTRLKSSAIRAGSLIYTNTLSRR